MHSHVDSTWPSVHPTTMKTSSNPGYIWTKLPPWRHAAHRPCSQLSQSAPMADVCGGAVVGGVHTLGIPRTHHSDSNNILLPRVPGHRFQPTVSQNNVRPGHETTTQLSGWPSHVSAPGQGCGLGSVRAPEGRRLLLGLMDFLHGPEPVAAASGKHPSSYSFQASACWYASVDTTRSSSSTRRFLFQPQEVPSFVLVAGS